MAYQNILHRVVQDYRHAIPVPRDNIYRRVRYQLQLTQRQAGARLGITSASWSYRERHKRTYYAVEIVALHEMSGMSDRDFIKLLKECA